MINMSAVAAVDAQQKAKRKNKTWFLLVALFSVYNLRLKRP
jgi:hypothetical protein